jgi:hypothetical protein
MCWLFTLHSPRPLIVRTTIRTPTESFTPSYNPAGRRPLLQKQMPAESHPVSPLERCTIVQGVRAQARLDCLSEEMVRTPEKGSATPFTMGNSSITSDDDSLDSSVSLLCAGYNVHTDINALGFSGGPV